ITWRGIDSAKGYSQEINVLDTLSLANYIGNENFIVPEGVNDIKYLAFRWARFKTVSLPSSLQSLEASAFYLCENLEKITCYAKVPPVMTQLYYGVPGYLLDIFKGSIYVPSESVELYRKADGWNKFDILPIAVVVSGITLTSEAITLDEGQTYQLSASVEPSDATDKTLTWSSSDEKVAIVSENGLVTAVHEGTAVITVCASNGVKANCTVIVEPRIVEVTDILLDRSELIITEGDNAILMATVNPADATDKTLVWTSSDENVATVSATGEVTAINKGTAVITVSSSNGISATCVVTVEAKIIEMESIVLNAEIPVLEIGETYQLIATVVPADTTYPELQWWTDNEHVAAVDQNGLVTVTGEGETMIHVRSSVWNHVEASCLINAIADVEGVICEDQSCDIYSFSGELLRKGVAVSEIEHLRKGVYIICQGRTRIKLIK
ncbi:MAG: Ig-like domain-containing protein, partial [Muribaculaceae bacterium]|nr:Ig-like domain-containing protein [Muribaculaceae bacterium]